MDGIRQPDIVDPGADEYFRFAGLRAADAGRTAIDLPLRHDRGFVRLRVRAQPNTGRRRELLRAVDIPHQTRAVNEDLRRRKI